MFSWWRANLQGHRIANEGAIDLRGAEEDGFAVWFRYTEVAFQLVWANLGARCFQGHRCRPIHCAVLVAFVFACPFACLCAQHPKGKKWVVVWAVGRTCFLENGRDGADERANERTGGRADERGDCRSSVRRSVGRPGVLYINGEEK